MDQKDLFVVGIGSSAGGIESLFELFSHIPADVDAAFVVIRHLKRDTPTVMTSLLARFTPLETITIQGGERLEPGKIYLMPENKKAFMKNGAVYIEPRPEREIINDAINRFFISLANDVKDKAIGIVLSGTGEDGVEGAKAIENNGGIVMVQSPETAKFRQLPDNMIAKNHPDHVLPPREMPFVIIDYINRKTQEQNGSS